MDEFYMLLDEYREKFDDVPTTMGVPPEVLEEKGTAALRKAIENGEALTNEAWFSAIGLKAPTEDDVV